MTPTTKKIVFNAHFLTSVGAFIVLILTKVFHVDAETANQVITGAVGIMLVVDGIIAGNSNDMVPGVETKTTVTAVQVSAPDAAAVKAPETPKP